MSHWLHYFKREKAHLILWLLIIVLIIVLLIVGERFSLKQNYRIREVKINNQTIRVKIVDQPSFIFKGLSGQESLAENQGMLFVFPKPDIYEFWMKEMKFPLDIIWINNNQIVEIWSNAPRPKGSEIPSYRPQNLANYVLEVKAGMAAEYGWKVGDSVKIKN